MASIFVRLKAREGMEQEAERLMKQMYEDTHRYEPKCHRYEYWRGQTPGSYYMVFSATDYLGYLDHAAAGYHTKTDWNAVYEVIENEWVDPVPGANDAVPTETMPVPSDIDEAKKAASQRHVHVVKKPDWWGR
ncbi:MAG: putative quinol monooxygenase [Sphingomonadales bacterium]